MNKEYRFYDTQAFLKSWGELSYFNIPFAISTETIIYLEKDKSNFRKILLDLKERNNYDVWIYTEDMINKITEKKILNSEKYIDLACALDYDIKKHPDETIFVTSELSTAIIANLFFGEDSIKLI